MLLKIVRLLILDLNQNKYVTESYRQIVRFSIECRRTRTKIIKTANQRKGKYPKKPIRIQSKTSKLLKARENKKTAQSAGKQANCSKARENVGLRVVIVLLCIWLVKNFWTNHRANQRKTKAIPDNFGHSLEDCPFNSKTKLNPCTPLKSFHLGVEVIRDRNRFP